MGCGSSSGASDPSSGNYNDDPELNDETGSRMKFNKKTGEARELKDGVDDELFAVEDAGEGEQFMAVKPWIGQIAEPDNHNPVNNDKPDERYALDYVYGYRCADSRQNCFINENGEVVYMTAALGVILDHNANTQKFFGGGEVANQSKQRRNDEDGHNNDITSIDLCSHRKMAVSGQVGSRPTVFVWNAITGEKMHKFELKKGARGVQAVGWAEDNSMFACVDLHNDHNVHVFNVEKGNLVMSDKGGPDRIMDVKWSRQPGSKRFATAGIKHIYFWDGNDQSAKKKGLFGSNEMTSMSCVAWDNEGFCYSGGSNSRIYKWEDRSCAGTLKAHAKGFICTMKWHDGILYSGGKDGCVVLTRTSDFQVQSKVDFDCLVRAVDFNGTDMVVGLRSGTIIHCKPDGSDKKEIMHSHNNGEVWGLDFDTEGNVYTSADDNQVITWDPTKRCRKNAFQVTDRKQKSKKGGASKLCKLPDSQCSRAVAVHNDDIAVAGNDGAVMIKDRNTGAEKHLMQDSSEWIEVMHYSPDGKKLAVGSHDNNIYIYDVENGYNLVGTLKAHNSYITNLDWAVDGSYIRSNCGAYELLFFKMDDCSQDPSGRSNTTGVTWATETAKFSWNVEGIFPSGTDGTHINGVNGSKNGMLIACGDDYGLVQVYRNPAREGAQPRSLRGHSEHVTRVGFAHDDCFLFSVGGYDQTLMQWKK